MSRRAIPVLIFLFLASQCLGQSKWQVKDVGPFTISLPSGWVFQPARGVDSFIGSFKGDMIALSFDYGWYSNSLSDYEGKDYRVNRGNIIAKFAHKFRIGHRTKIVNARAEKGLIGMYLQNKLVMRQWVALSITSTQDLSSSQRQLVLKIFKSIKFKKDE
jgi:hypothetical protein